MKQHASKVMAFALALVLILSTAACGTAASTEESSSQASTQSSNSAESSKGEPISESSSEVSAAQAISSASESTTDAEEGDTQASERYDFYSWNPTDYTYHSITHRKDSEELRALLLNLKRDNSATPDKSSEEKLGFLVYTADSEKSTYYVTPTQVYDKDKQVLNATAEQCQTLYDAAKESNRNHKGVPQWLAYMSLERITEVSFDGLNENGTQDISFQTQDAKAIRSIWAFLRNLKVKPDSTIKRDTLNFNAPADLIRMRLEFNSGVQYDIFLQGEFLGVLSTDMGFSLSYAMDSPQQANKLRTIAEEISCEQSSTAPSEEKGNPATGKPVIYLYPTVKTDVSVKLNFGGKLWYTYPAYNNGWNVTAYPDGRLINKADETEHYYLFWDGDSDTEWRLDEGFCVKGTELEGFLREKLAYMGLTPREYNDFITFWVPKLQGNKYNLITFATTQYEQLAPLTISPKPDSVLRVHMVYKALDQKVSIPEQRLSAFERKGFTVVEWGGSRA
ncbi:hypothetical protein [Hydrogenoanaerobacterium sp.]|uniref:hypothetical protein n=1 Tax=Hydrogenoanaerobacterium sp. TaxID=2953763 RepID=UPI0028991DB2|nr:hypothetical protein [Hydrogenoanaerobacterium sp.]